MIPSTRWKGEVRSITEMIRYVTTGGGQHFPAATSPGRHTGVTLHFFANRLNGCEFRNFTRFPPWSTWWLRGRVVVAARAPTSMSPQVMEQIMVKNFFKCVFESNVF